MGQASEKDVKKQAEAAVTQLLNIGGPAYFSKITYWRDALPQYELGHLERLEAIETGMAAHANVHLAGTSYRGVGIPDCIRQGREAAHKIAQLI